MIKSRGRLGFALETAEGLRILGYVVGQEFQCYKAAELHILGFINYAHTTGAEFFDYAVMRDGFADQRVGGRHAPHILGCARRQVNEAEVTCRRKMRMSGLCKVEMSAFMDGRGPHGNGANHFEPTRAGSIESVRRGTAEAVDAGSGGRAAESKRPPRAANAAAPARVRRSLLGSRTGRPALEPQASGPLGAEGSGAPAPALCGFRSHLGRGTPGPGGFFGEPGDATEVDDPGGLLGGE